MENNEHTEHKSSLQNRILARIKNKELSMHSQSYLLLKVASLVVVLLFALVVSVFLFSFLFFSIRINIQDSLMHMGPTGALFFINFFPWHLLLLDILLLALAELLIRRFRFGYQRPVLYLFFVFLCVALALGLFIDRVTGFNDRMLDRAHSNRLPLPINDMYEHARHIPGPQGF